MTRYSGLDKIVTKHAARQEEPGEGRRFFNFLVPWMGTGLGVGTGQGAYLEAIEPKMFEKGTLSQYKQLIRNAGGKLPKRLTPDEILRQLTGSSNPAAAAAMEAQTGGAGFIPNLNVLMKGKRTMSPGILAHELGHAKGMLAKNNKLLTGAYHMGKLGPLAATLGIAGAGDKDRAKTYTALGTLSTAPMLAEELGASIRGTKMLKGVKGLGRFGRLSPFMGLPTYAMLAAAPSIAYALRKKMRKE